MSPRYTLPLVLLVALLGGVSPASAATCTWNGSTNIWQTPSAWSCGAVPGSSDDVVIGSGTVTFSGGGSSPGAVTVRSLTLTGGTLDGDGTVTVSESFVWEAGTMAGEGSTIVLGGAELRAATAKNVGRTIYLRGGTTWSNGTLQMRDGGRLVNEGVFTDNAVGTHSIARTGTITNEPLVLNRGTWRSESAGTNLNVDFANEGSLVIGGGGLDVNNPGRLTLATTGFLFGEALLDVSSGAVVSMAGRTAPGAAAIMSFPVRGPFPMTSDHVLDLDLKGGANNWDRLLVEDGDVTVDGRLHLRISDLAPLDIGAEYPILSQTGTGDVTGCYGPEDILVTGPDGVAPAPYRVEVTCTADSVTALVFVATAADEDGPTRETAEIALAGPNPFDAQTSLALTLPEAGPATVAAFDALGRQVAVLFEGAVAAGQTVPVVFDARALPAGVYVVRLAAGGQAAALRLTVAK